MYQRRYIWKTLIDFLFVVRHWREYYSIISEIFHPWFDVVEGTEAMYMSDPDNWHCKFCNCRYWHRLQDPSISMGLVGLHRPDCLWTRITRLRQDGGF